MQAPREPGRRQGVGIAAFWLLAAAVGAGVGAVVVTLASHQSAQAVADRPLHLPQAFADAMRQSLPEHEATPLAEQIGTDDNVPSPPPMVRPAGSYLVVLDPGHGGSNSGAAGVVEGVYEKRLTLELAREVAARLRREPGVIVVLTREDDHYMTLRARTRLANAVGADAFVSIHANASPGRSQRGFETWVLSPDALTVDSRAIRSGDGPLRQGVPDDVAQILDDVERGAAQPEALLLAASMQSHLASVWGASDGRGVRQGTQDVLMGLTMPGVLVEVGFIDHPVEGAALMTHDTRAKLAAAVAEAILARRPALAATR